ncbi:MAG: hypothetical protein BAJATHORv1_10193 [Candidatus Thorarchaeota archaeon]|nr:MAG: hypothetical protein BAJATHORv1_10193 [Candidatus Thorarchaeota archaeon]
MSDEASIGKLEKKVDRISEELAAIREVLKAVSIIPSLAKKVDAIDSDLDAVKKEISPVTKIDELLSSVRNVDTGLKKVQESKDIQTLGQKMEDIANTIMSIDTGIKTMTDAKEGEVIIKKIDDVLISMKDVDERLKEASSDEGEKEIRKKMDDIINSVAGLCTSVKEVGDTSGSQTEVISKKIDELQSYVASLSTLEERISDLSDSFGETKEIVGIIVRQLDDIERKYNKTLKEVNEALAVIGKFVDTGYAPEEKETKSKKQKKAEDSGEEEPSVDYEPEGTMDEIMQSLLDMVKPQTEAVKMAEALEKARDTLTEMIKVHSPVLFQFGKVARELKSYPATATLNENDIARLNKEFRSWIPKLKEAHSG